MRIRSLRLHLRLRLRPVLRWATALMMSVASACGLLFAAAPAASAIDASLTLNYSCPFPLLGYQPVQVAIAAQIPDTLVAGHAAAIAFTADVTVPASSTGGLAFMNTSSISGSARASATLADSASTLPLSLPLQIPATPVPASGSFVVHAAGQSPTITLPSGAVTIDVGSFITALTPVQSVNGTTLPTAVGTFQSRCTIDPGKSTTLATFQVAPPPIGGNYAVGGEAHFGAANADAKLGPGTLTGSFDGTGGSYSADLSLPPTDVSYTLLGFLPGTATFRWTEAGKTTGKVSGGVLALDSPVTVGITDAALLGLPLVQSSSSCQSTSPADRALTSGVGFQPASPTAMTGTFSLPAFSGCGMADGLLASWFSGGVDTISEELSPR